MGPNFVHPKLVHTPQPKIWQYVSTTIPIYQCHIWMTSTEIEEEISCHNVQTLSLFGGVYNVTSSRWSTFCLRFFSWLLAHVFYLKQRKKYCCYKLSNSQNEKYFHSNRQFFFHPGSISDWVPKKDRAIFKSVACL